MDRHCHSQRTMRLREYLAGEPALIPMISKGTRSTVGPDADSLKRKKSPAGAVWMSDLNLVTRWESCAPL